MSSQHLGISVSTRVSPDIRDSAAEILDAAGWTQHAYLAACLEALIADPDAMLATVVPHRRPARRMGRPPKPRPDATT